MEGFYMIAASVMKELKIKDSSNIDNNNYRENKPVIYQNSACYTVEHVSNMCRTWSYL